MLRQCRFILSRAVLVAVLGCARSYEPPPPVPIPLTQLERRAVGCYQFVIGPWRVLETGEPGHGGGVYTTPPTIVRLDSLPLADSTNRRAHEIQLARGARPSIHRLMHWGRNGGPGQLRLLDHVDSLSLDFSTGLSGLSMTVALHGDSLVGWAHDFWDFMPTSQEARVVAHRVPCENQEQVHPQPPNRR